MHTNGLFRHSLPALAILLFASFCAPLSRAQNNAFSPGDQVIVTKDTSMFFNMKLVRTGHKGDVFTVILYKPEISRLWVAEKDATGRDIALNFNSDDARFYAAPTPIVQATPPQPGEKPATPSALDAPTTGRVSKATYLVTTDLGQGSAFLLSIRDQAYLVTNYHVVIGAKTIKCANQFDTFELKDGLIEVADDRDMVRIPVDKKEALEVAPDVAADTPVAAFGNSGGKDVVTKLDGKVLGVGPGEIEVSCEFIPGNSGGPIADSQGRVAGIATYVARGGGVPDWVKQGTRFEGARRFGVRVTDDILWSKTTIAQFQAETKILADMDSLFEDFLNVARNLALTPFAKRIAVQHTADQPLENIVETYNKQCADATATSGRAVDNDELATINRKFHARVKTHVLSLARAIREDSQSMSLRYQKTFTTPHTKTEATKMLSDMTELAAFLEKNVDDISPDGLFHMEAPPDKYQRPGATPPRPPVTGMSR